MSCISTMVSNFCKSTYESTAIVANFMKDAHNNDTSMTNAEANRKIQTVAGHAFKLAGIALTATAVLAAVAFVAHAPIIAAVTVVLLAVLAHDAYVAGHELTRDNKVVALETTGTKISNAANSAMSSIGIAKPNQKPASYDKMESIMNLTITGRLASTIVDMMNSSTKKAS
jgi:hypothetical protein